MSEKPVEITVIGARLGERHRLDRDNRIVFYLLRHWPELGAKVKLYTTAGGLSAARLNGVDNVEIELLGPKWAARLPGPLRRAVEGAAAFHAARRVRAGTAVCSGSHSWTDILAAQRVRRYNLESAWVGSLHLGYADSLKPARPQDGRWGRHRSLKPRPGAWIARALLSQIKRDADLVFVCNGGDKENHYAEFPDRLFDLGVAFPSAAPTGPAYRAYDGCFIGSSIDPTGWVELAATWRHVLDYRPQAKLAIMIEDLDKIPRRLGRLFNAPGVAKTVTWVLGPPQKTRDTIFRASGAFVHPFPTVGSNYLGQALSAGLPVIGFDSPIFRLDYRRGRLLAPKGDCASLGNLLIHISNKPGLYRRLSQEALSIAAARRDRTAADRALDAIRSVGKTRLTK